MEQRDKVLAQKPLLVTPALDELPVFVRGGTILPIAPLTQSTAEIPTGPLTLRVFPLTPGFDSPSATCSGEVYSDDGHSFNFRKGEFARVQFNCSTGPDGTVKVQIGRQEGTWKPWWHRYRIEVVGMTPKSPRAAVNQRLVTMTQLEGRWGVTVDASSAETSVEMK